MASSDSAFIGSVPEFYDHYLRFLQFQPYADDMADRLRGLTAGTLLETTLLETAAGTGIVTQTLAALLPPAVQIVATDLNQAMLDYAATKPGMQNVRFQQADAQALPFTDAAFDVVVCQFGAMFFPDRVTAFRAARRVLRPGGRLLFNVWDRRAENPVKDATIAGLEKRYPAHPSWFLERTPCGYHDPDRIRADLRAAGFADCVIETVTRIGRAPDARAVATGFCQGTPMRAEIEGLDPGGLDAATEAAAKAVAARFGAGPVAAKLQALVIEARK